MRLTAGRTPGKVSGRARRSQKGIGCSGRIADAMPVDQMPRGKEQRSIGDVTGIQFGHCGKHIGWQMVMNKTAIVVAILRKMLIMRIHNRFMRMTVMMHMLDHRSDGLVMPRLMRAPCQPWHDQRANEQQEEQTGHERVNNGRSPSWQ
ncbi:hypothetical protein MACH24_16580 [Erythrobacter sp. Dej080120_24]|uniref:hypothetical protein n=1 Tax=Erythrobacter sp. Dej080120_24 TaxID=3024837 RepID=UPI0029253F51|nr:hypothetical protein MACH24_16580 [Erythrobacter sp. Dej080120_24]